MASAAHPGDRSVLAGRIQGFGNVNPPPIEEETGTTIAKRAVGRLGDLVGEEVMLTVEDFREKGAVGAVKDAVADAGDILIDGVSGIISWIRGEPPPEEESEKTEDATKALSNGPAGAAYGISQASPTGGINAVWVMPDEADPQALAQLAQQTGGQGMVNQQNDPRVPKNIQPYQPSPKQGATSSYAQAGPNFPMQLPGGPTIAPYQPAPSGPGARAALPPPYIPGQAGSFQQPPRWGPGGYNPASLPGAGPGPASQAGSGAKSLVDRLAKGEVLPGPDAAKRLVSICAATKTSSKQLGEMVCERTRRLYLGLDGSEYGDGDAALARLLTLTDLLAQSDSDLAKSAAQEIKSSVTEELVSLRSNSKHKDAAEPMLRRLGLLGQAPAAAAAAAVDLLGAGEESDLLGSSEPAKEADLLGGMGAPAEPASANLSTLSGLDGVLSATTAATPASASSEGILSGLSLDTAPPPAAQAKDGLAPSGAWPAAAPATLGSGAHIAPQVKKDEDAFGFVGAEMFKASGP